MIINSKFCGVSHPKILYYYYFIVSRYWEVLRVSMLRHFNILSRRMPMGFNEIVIVDTMSAHGENLYFEGEGTITLL